MELEEECYEERLSADYKNFSQRFSKQFKDFTKQYCSIYTVRLKILREMLKERILKKWGTVYPICALHKLSETNFPKCIVIGTLFKDQKLKPSVLKQLATANSLVPQPVYTHFTDESDKLYIEDELQRFLVLGKLNELQLVTGITCALLGSDNGNGKFSAEDYCFVGFAPQVARPILLEDSYVVFISGLDLIHIEKTLLSLRLFVNWITGLLGDINDIPVAKIIRLIVTGNSIQTVPQKTKSRAYFTSRSTELPEVIEAVKLSDTIFLELAQTMEVDIMPGEHDPSNHVLPQLPMHYCMFPKSVTLKSLNQVSNPYEFELSGVRMLGTSGQPVSDILAYSDMPEAIEALGSCLKWSHLAPTAPDTLGCFPFYESDPFVIEKCPHVFFAGNQQHFSTKICEGEDGQQVRLICIPSFAETFKVVVLNLKNLDCTPISFKQF